MAKTIKYIIEHEYKMADENYKLYKWPIEMLDIRESQSKKMINTT